MLGDGPSRLPELVPSVSNEAPSSPDREQLNTSWDTAQVLEEPAPEARRLGPLRKGLRRLARAALGPFLESQVAWNSFQVRFDNELVAYVDERLDRLAAHYDHVLGLHGKRMEEIDERHSILQQELVRHVHDLVERIEFVFESAETNHLYLEGMLRETKEELEKLAVQLEALAPAGRDGT